MDLFESLSVDEKGLPAHAASAPLAVRMRPKELSELVGQEHLLKAGSPLMRLMDPEATSLPSVILWGPPGTGKTTLAYLIARQSGRQFAELSAVDSGVREVRKVIEEAKRRLTMRGAQTVLFIDEVHRFSKAQQDALLPAVENQWVTLVAATTENPSFSVISPLLSRSLMLVLEPLDDDAIRTALGRAREAEEGLAEEVELSSDAETTLVQLAGGDARKALTLLESAAEATKDRNAETITVEDVEAGAANALVRWDKDQHYDVASAFIKSMRGSDVDAAIHYLARQIEAGEDPRFIARRIVIAASEDVGMADPTALQVATAAAQAVAHVGMPEARIILSQAVIAVATAPKSNAAYLAIDRALADLRQGKGGPVPMHLRDTHYSGAKKLGHGEGYVYSHNEPHAIDRQTYLPDDLADAKYYEPTDRGEEALITKRLAAIQRIRDMG